MYGRSGAGRIVGMTTPHRPEADMLHMQHAQMLAAIMRRHDAELAMARRDAVAKARRTAQAAAEPAPARPTRKVRVHGPRPA
jgi:hypothetical protein